MFRFSDKKDLILIFLCTSLPLLMYSSLFEGFFQQDEWLGYARHILLTGSSPLELLSYAFSPSAGHYSPLTPLLVYLSFTLFGLNYNAHVLVSLILQAGVILFFYIFARFFFERKLAFFAALLFGLLAAPYQGTAWVVADLGTHLSSIFGLLSLIFITRYLDTNRKRYFILSVLLLFVSLLFKELALGLFAMIPLMIIFWGKQQTKRQKVTYSLIILSIGALYLLARAVMLISLSEKLDTAYTLGTSRVLYNIATVPIKSISQTVVPADLLKEMSFKVAGLFGSEFTGGWGSPQFEVFAVKRVMEALSIFLSLGLIVLLLAVVKLKQNKKIAIFGIVFVLLNSSVLAIVPEKQGLITAVDSRNLYFVSVGSSFIIISFLASLSKKYFVPVLGVVLLFNVYLLNLYLGQFNERGRIRREILQEVKSMYPAVSDKVVFYTESDASFYGLPESELVLPFQSGFGQTLLSWYYVTQSFPKELLSDRFLWEIDSQGYRETKQIGFGYFRDFELLAKTLKENNLSSETVLSLRYSMDDRKVFNITNEIKGRLAGYFAKKAKIDQKDWEVSLDPTKELEKEEVALLNLLKDGDRETAWRSQKPYDSSLSLTVNLRQMKRIAQIKLDVYNNKDQNNVGYKVLLSRDGLEWNQVFYSKKHPPDVNGIDDLYLNPLPAKFIRLEQAGIHKFAPWVIHEMDLYEASEK